MYCLLWVNSGCRFYTFYWFSYFRFLFAVGVFKQIVNLSLILLRKQVNVQNYKIGLICVTYNNVLIHCPSNFNLFVIFFFVTITIYYVSNKNKFEKSLNFWVNIIITCYCYLQKMMTISFQCELKVREILEFQLLGHHFHLNQTTRH